MRKKYYSLAEKIRLINEANSVKTFLHRGKDVFTPAGRASRLCGSRCTCAGEDEQSVEARRNCSATGRTAAAYSAAAQVKIYHGESSKKQKASSVGEAAQKCRIDAQL